jgi:hypothetical protein
VKVFAGVGKVDPSATETGDVGALPEPPSPAAYETVNVFAVSVTGMSMKILRLKFVRVSFW